MDMSDVSWDQWLMNSMSTSPADINYHGLFNQGATCYLNSVLQVLYMTGDFREAVERCAAELPECIDHQLKPLFDILKRKTAETSEITDKLGIDRVYEQRDAAVYCERILTLTSPEASQIFRGELTHRTTCSGCGTEMNADWPFWNLPLELVGSYREHYSVVDGIGQHFQTSYFSGENQMYCDQCDAKSDATITCVMKRHPEVLMLLLKRFEVDYSYMTYVKNDRAVDVPYTLQIPKNQTYELYAVVDHFGDLRGGHYTTTIKSEDDEQWYNFNDASVTLLSYQPFQVDNVERSQSVYLLFYRKKKTHVADTCAPEIRESFSNGGAPHPATIDNDDRLADVDKVTEREQGEEATEAGDETPEALPIEGSEETGIQDNVGVGSGEVVLLHVDDEDEDEDGAGDEQRLPHNRDNLLVEEEKQDEGEITKEEEEEEEEGEAVAQLNNTEEDQDCSSAGTEVDRDLKVEASDGHATPDHPHEKDETSPEEKRVLNIKMGSDGLDPTVRKG